MGSKLGNIVGQDKRGQEGNEQARQAEFTHTTTPRRLDQGRQVQGSTGAHSGAGRERTPTPLNVLVVALYSKGSGRGSEKHGLCRNGNALLTGKALDILTGKVICSPGRSAITSSAARAGHTHRDHRRGGVGAGRKEMTAEP